MDTLSQTTLNWKRMKKVWSNFKEDIRAARHETSVYSFDPLTKILILLFIFSCLDAYFTLVWIDSGLAIEANPLLEPLIAHGTFSFIATKLLLTAAGCVVLHYAKRESKLAAWSIIVLALGYCILTLYHIVGAVLSADHTLLPDFLNDTILFFT